MAFRLVLKRSTPKNQREGIIDKLVECFNAKQNLSFTVTERKPVPEGESEVPVTFSKVGIAEFMKRWAEWRISLKRKSLENLTRKEKVVLAKEENLLSLVVRKDEILEVLKEALNVKNAATVLVKKLKISQENAELILNMRIRTLQKLEVSVLKKTIKARKERISGWKRDHEDPTERLMDQLGNIAPTLTNGNENHAA